MLKCHNVNNGGVRETVKKTNMSWELFFNLFLPLTLEQIILLPKVYFSLGSPDRTWFPLLIDDGYTITSLLRMLFSPNLLWLAEFWHEVSLHFAMRQLYTPTNHKWARKIQSSNERFKPINCPHCNWSSSTDQASEVSLHQLGLFRYQSLNGVNFMMVNRPTAHKQIAAKRSLSSLVE